MLFIPTIMSVSKEIRKITTNTLQKMKANGEKISMLTAYDFSFAQLFDNAGIDIILVAAGVTAGPLYPKRARREGSLPPGTNVRPAGSCRPSAAP